MFDRDVINPPPPKEEVKVVDSSPLQSTVQDSVDDMEVSVTDTRKKGNKRSNVDAFDAKDQNKVQIGSGSCDLQGTSHLGNPLVVPELCVDVEASLAPLADSERDTENSEVSQDVLSVCPDSQACSDELTAVSDSDGKIDKGEIPVS